MTSKKTRQGLHTYQGIHEVHDNGYHDQPLQDIQGFVQSIHDGNECLQDKLLQARKHAIGEGRGTERTTTHQDLEQNDAMASDEKNIGEPEPEFDSDNRVMGGCGTLKAGIR